MPGGDGERIAAERAGLVHRPERREQLHHVSAPRHGGQRKAAAHDLAERDEVGCPQRTAGACGLEAPPAGGPDPEAGQHLVEDEERAFAVRDLGERLVEPVGGHEHTRVRAGGLGDDRGDPSGVRGERRLHGRQVVVGQHDRERSDVGGHAGRPGQAEGRDARPRLGEQPVGVTVIVPGELDDEVAAGRPAGQPHGGHGRLGAGGDETDAVEQARAEHRGALAQQLGEHRFTRRRRPERETAGGGILHRRNDLRGAHGRAGPDPTSRRGRCTPGLRRR